MEGTAAAAWIGSCFSHCPEIRVTFLQSRIAARANPPSLTRTEARGTYNDVRVQGTSTTVSNFPIAFRPRCRKLWRQARSHWGKLRDSAPNSRNLFPKLTYIELFLNINCGRHDSLPPVSFFHPSFLPHFFGLLNLESAQRRRPWIDFRLSNRFGNQDLNFHAEGIT